MRQHFLVVAVIKQAALCNVARPVGPVDGGKGNVAGRCGHGFDMLGGKGGNAGERLLADPGEHGAALGAGDGDVLLAHFLAFSAVSVRWSQFVTG